MSKRNGYTSARINVSINICVYVYSYVYTYTTLAVSNLQEYCCCDSGYTWAADACDLETTTTLPVPDAEDSSGRSTLLFCETFDQEDVGHEGFRAA